MERVIYTGSPEKGHTESIGPGSKERCQLHPELHYSYTTLLFYSVALTGTFCFMEREGEGWGDL